MVIDNLFGCFATPFYKLRYVFLQPSAGSVFAFSLMVLVMVSLARPAWPEDHGDSQAPGVVDPMQASIDSALASHRVELADLKAQMKQLETVERTVQERINVYDSENASHRQLMLVSHTRTETLENALRNNRLESRRIEQQLQTIQARYEMTVILFKQTADGIALASKQIADIQASRMNMAQKQASETATRSLIRLLKEKEQLGDRFMKIYTRLIKQLTTALADKEELGDQLADQLEHRNRTSILTTSAPYRQLFDDGLYDIVGHAAKRLGAVFNPLVWRSQWDQIKMGGFLEWLVFFFWLILIIVLQARSGAFLKRLEADHGGPDWHYRRLGVFLLRHSLLYLGLALLFGVYSDPDKSLLDVGLGRTLFRTFMVLSLVRWGQDYLEREISGSPTVFGAFIYKRLTRLFTVLRPIIIAGIVLEWVTGEDSLPSLITLDFLIIGLLAWTMVFWRQVQPIRKEGVRQGEVGPSPRWMALARWWGYLVLGGGLLVSLAGYRMLATHWYISWTMTSGLLFWGWVNLNIIREWRSSHQSQVEKTDADHSLDSAYHLRGSLIQLVRFVWFVSLVIGIIWAWDSSNLLMTRVASAINHTFTIGSLKLSLNGLVHAVIILFLTSLVIRIGRTLLSERILADKSLEPGFKSSILTISGYLAWGLGLILALGTLGVNATSLAVVFGALSVGIGFGLQTIFNNFISGLILLFERPIQVGDYVEINGLWAEVKKINVRATVVQTFDNASVIIPNSEFISQQVTNWSFKDKRMRRSIEVGVAYGSDIGLVQATLLEIATDNRDVLRYPKPDVLFIDHAASALIFRLRIWVYVDHYWSVPSKVRGDIDNRFCELGIEIAFPQQDVHIRTIPGKIASEGDPHRDNN